MLADWEIPLVQNKRLVILASQECRHVCFEAAPTNLWARATACVCAMNQQRSRREWTDAAAELNSDTGTSP
jgi:hypothetical protein